MFLSPKPSTTEIIDKAFSSSDFDEIEVAAHRLFFDEEVEKFDFRLTVYQRLKSSDLALFTKGENKRAKLLF